MWHRLQQGHSVSQKASSLGPGRSSIVISVPVHPSVRLSVFLSVQFNLSDPSIFSLFFGPIWLKIHQKV